MLVMFMLFDVPGKPAWVGTVLEYLGSATSQRVKIAWRPDSKVQELALVKASGCNVRAPHYIEDLSGC